MLTNLGYFMQVDLDWTGRNELTGPDSPGRLTSTHIFSQNLPDT